MMYFGVHPSQIWFHIEKPAHIYHSFLGKPKFSFEQVWNDWYAHVTDV